MKQHLSNQQHSMIQSSGGTRKKGERRRDRDRIEERQTNRFLRFILPSFSFYILRFVGFFGFVFLWVFLRFFGFVFFVFWGCFQSRVYSISFRKSIVWFQTLILRLSKVQTCQAKSECIEGRELFSLVVCFDVTVTNSCLQN